MEAIRDSIEKTLRIQVDERATVREGPPPHANPLSPFLKSAFDLYSANAAESVFVVAALDDKEDPQAAMMRLDALQQALDTPAVLHATFLPASTRRELITSRQGFMTTGGDVYLPHMALMLTASRDGALALPGTFTPSEQSVFLYCLYCEEPSIAQDAVQERLGLSSASVSRALSSLCSRKFLDYEVGGMTGRRKLYTIPDKRQYYRDGIELFGNPIAKRYLASLAAYDKQPLFSGITALSALSNLTRPSRDVVAVGHAESNAIVQAESYVPGHEKRYEVQVLRYDPWPLSNMVWHGMKYVDPVTMALTIGGRERDERVSISLRSFMSERGYEWYTG